LTQQLAGHFNWLPAGSLSSDNFDTGVEIVALSKTDIANCATNANQEQLGDQ
jgi:hypothetical protein